MPPLPVDAYRRIDARGLAHGSSYLDELLLSPRDVVARFGPPGYGDGYKVSGSYTFVREPGVVFTLYDWKLTSLHERGNGIEEGHPGASLPTPEAFWATGTPEQLNIGGFEDRGDVGHFKRWLLQQVG
jgi:hypothetical protein